MQSMANIQAPAGILGGFRRRMSGVSILMFAQDDGIRRGQMRQHHRLGQVSS